MRYIVWFFFIIHIVLFSILIYIFIPLINLPLSPFDNFYEKFLTLFFQYAFYVPVIIPLWISFLAVLSKKKRISYILSFLLSSLIFPLIYFGNYLPIDKDLGTSLIQKLYSFQFIIYSFLFLVLYKFFSLFEKKSKNTSSQLSRSSLPSLEKKPTPEKNDSNQNTSLLNEAESNKNEITALENKSNEDTSAIEVKEDKSSKIDSNEDNGENKQ